MGSEGNPHAWNRNRWLGDGAISRGTMATVQAYSPPFHLVSGRSRVMLGPGFSLGWMASPEASRGARSIERRGCPRRRTNMVAFSRRGSCVSSSPARCERWLPAWVGPEA